MIQEKVFFPRDGDCLWAAMDLRILTDTYRDESNQPLLPDLNSGQSAYLSNNYDNQLEIPLIKTLGAAEMSTLDFLKRLDQDMMRSFSRMRSRNTTDKWHSKVANILLAATKERQHAMKIEKMALIPLTNDSWVPSLNASIFYATTGGIDVPSDLSLALVHKEAAMNKARRSLFSKLGVTECHPSRIFPLIEQRYSVLARDVSVDERRSHYQFAFWHNDKLLKKGLSINFLNSDDDGGQFIAGNKGQGWTYCLQSNGDYTMSSIFDAKVPDELKGQFQFPHLSYYLDIEAMERRNNLTGVEWLRSFLSLKANPKLQDRQNPTRRSPELKYIAKHKPELLLGVLHAGWGEYVSCREWDSYFRSIEVPILDSGKKRKLEQTYLPLPRLKRNVSSLGLSAEFGFIQELKDVTDNEAIQWRFLERFGVGVGEDVSFWLAILRRAREKTNIEDSVALKIYTELQKFTGIDDTSKIK